MREIKFRGRDYYGNWYYGFYQGNTKIAQIVNASDCYNVIHETVGQFTGLTDKNGVEIYEGDILRIKSELNNNHNDYPIEFRSGSFVAWCHGDNNGIILHKIKHSDFEVIGNIHDK